MKISGFTLVELVVVITILAILAAIGFLSLQGYSGDARDAIRQFDVKSIGAILSVSGSGREALFEKSTEVINFDNEVRCYVYHEANFCISKDGGTSYVFTTLSSPIELELQEDYRKKFINGFDFPHRNAYVPKHLYAMTVGSGSFVIDFERFLSKENGYGAHIDVSDQKVETLIKKLMLGKQIDATNCYVLGFKENNPGYDIITSSSSCDERFKSDSGLHITFRKEDNSRTEFSSGIGSVYFDFDALEFNRLQKEIDKGSLNDRIAYIGLLLGIVGALPIFFQIVFKKDANAKMLSKHPVISYGFLAVVLASIVMILFFA